MKTIVLADDHKLVRQGIRALLEAEVDFQVIGESGDGLETLRLVERLTPNVLVLDLMMPGINGLEVTRQVKKNVPQTAIIIVSMYANEAYVLEALGNGAAAYVLKDSSASDLVYAVREVTAGRHYLSPPLSERAIAVYQETARVTATNIDKYETLTTREREVLQLSAEGCTNQEIAGRLGISARTVETHRAHLIHKLDLHTQADLIRYALRRGIIALDE
jgi:two-component system, NarL family, response regulator NreC